jgi:hypothetical protein
MWFKLPPGVGGISVAQQEFNPEFSDDEGSYFRAPDHFAALILDGTGISALNKPPPGAPADLPKANSPEANNVLQLTGHIESLKLDKISLETSVTILKTENQDLKNELNEAQAMLSQFAEDNPKLATELGYKKAD